MLLFGGLQGTCYSQKVFEIGGGVMRASELREKALPAVVYIKTEKGYGSGVVIKTSEGNTFVLSNEHVTADNDEVEVFFLAYDAKQNEIRDSEFYFGSKHSTDLLRRLGYTIKARVVAEDKEADVAVIDLSGLLKTVDSISLNNVDVYDNLKTGDAVHFLGHPGDQVLLWQWNLGQFKGYEDRWLLLEGRTWKGNSGGPLLNEKGELIGLIKATDDVTETWAVPLEPIIDLVKGLKQWDIISVVNETETDVVYEINWSEDEAWEENTLEPGEWKFHRHPTKVFGSFQTKIRYVSTIQQTQETPIDTDTKKPEEQDNQKPEDQDDQESEDQDDKKPEEQDDQESEDQDDKKPEEQDDKKQENLPDKEYKLNYVKRYFFSSEGTERIKPKLDGYNYRFVSPDSKNIEFQQMRQTVWIANDTKEKQKYSIKWSGNRFDEDNYTLEPGKIMPHWSTRTILGLAANYPKIRYKYSVSHSDELTKQWGTLEKTLTITKETQFFPIEAKPDEYIKDIEDVRKSIKDSEKGYYYLYAFQANSVPNIYAGLPHPKIRQTKTPKKWEKWIVPISIGITVLSLSIAVAFGIQYFYPKRHIFSIENNTDSTVDFHIKWTKKAAWQASSLEPEETQIYMHPGFLKKKPVIHFVQIVNYARETSRVALATRSQRYSRNAATQNYREIAHKYDFDYNEENEIQLFASDTE